MSHGMSLSQWNLCQALTALQGVGPATASALLCRAFPQHVAYMSDEAPSTAATVEPRFVEVCEVEYDSIGTDCILV